MSDLVGEDVRDPVESHIGDDWEVAATDLESPASSANGRRRSASRRERAVSACKVKARDGEVEGEAEAEADTCAESGYRARV